MSAAARLAIVLALAGGGCSSGPRLRSADLVLDAERPGEGRASVTALALDTTGERLLIGDYGGRLEVLDAAALRRSESTEPRPSRFDGGVLALGWQERRFVAVPRRGRALDSAEPRDPGAERWFLFSPLSGAVVTPALDVVCWSVVARTLGCAAPPSRGGAETSVKDVRIAGAAALADRAIVLDGRAPAPTRLEARALPSLDVQWSADLGHSANAVAVDATAHVVVVADASQIELRSLDDGALLGAVPVAGATPVAFGDGERVLLVQGEVLSVLHLHRAAGSTLEPRIEPAFTAHRGGVGAVAVSADARWLATGGARGDLLLFRIEPLARPAALSP